MNTRPTKKSIVRILQQAYHVLVCCIEGQAAQTQNPALQLAVRAQSLHGAHIRVVCRENPAVCNTAAGQSQQACMTPLECDKVGSMHTLQSLNTSSTGSGQGFRAPKGSQHSWLSHQAGPYVTAATVPAPTRFLLVAMTQTSTPVYCNASCFVEQHQPHQPRPRLSQLEAQIGWQSSLLLVKCRLQVGIHHRA